MFLPYKYIETQDFEKGFAEHYKRHILPLALKHEPIRGRRKYTQYLNILTALSITAVSIKAILKSSWFLKAGRKKGNLLLLPIMIFWYWIVRWPRNRYFTAVKSDVLPKILEFFGEFEYQPKDNMYESLRLHYSLFQPLIKTNPHEDIITYKKGDAIIRLFEKTSQLITNYDGQLYISLTLPHLFASEVLILSKTPESSGFSSTQESREKERKRLLSERASLKEIKLGNNRFDSTFLLYANNAANARAWLNHEFVIELIKLNYLFDKEGLSLSIRGNELLLELSAKHNLFEVGTKYDNPIANVMDIKKLLTEIHFIMGIADRLCLQSVNLVFSNTQHAAKTERKAINLPEATKPQAECRYWFEPR